MEKVVDPNRHAALDYVLGISCLAIPVLAGFDRASSFVSYGIGLTHLGISLLTKYPPHVVEVIPFRLHGVMDLQMAVSLMALPFALRFLDNKAKTFFFSSGVGLLAICVLTDYSRKAVEASERELQKIIELSANRVAHLIDSSPATALAKEESRMQ